MSCGFRDGACGLKSLWLQVASAGNVLHAMYGVYTELYGALAGYCCTGRLLNMSTDASFWAGLTVPRGEHNV
jgi:hypothetical protein